VIVEILGSVVGTVEIEVELGNNLAGLSLVELVGNLVELSRLRLPLATIER
jgi:hypothetical protein